jgi:hypothetical protein
MRRPAAIFSIALALGAIILAPKADAQPTPISACPFTANQPGGSYALVGPLMASGTCITITRDFVTIDLAGFSIMGNGSGTGIVAMTAPPGVLRGVAVRNGSIANFDFGVDIGDGSIVEGLRVSNTASAGIQVSSGIVRGNSVYITEGAPGISVTGAGAAGTGVGNGGTVTGNYVAYAGPGIDVASAGTVRGNTTNNNDNWGIRAGSGSTIIGNTAAGNGQFGISATCPSNLTDNTATGSFGPNLVLNGNNCHNEDNVAP